MISVIIPCYNGGAVIDRSIQSVYDQDCEAVELIVVDDGSTDNSKVHILDWKPKYEAKGFNLKYIYQKNEGLGSAINTGLKHVSGRYLSLLDADDYFLQNSINKRVKYLDEHPDYSGVRTNGWILSNGEKSLFPEDDRNKKTTDLFYSLLYNRACNWAGSYMIRTDVLFDFYPDRNIYSSRFGQNMQLLLPTAYKRKFGYIDEPLMVYVIHDNSHSHSLDRLEQQQKDNENFYGYFDIYMHMIKSIVTDPVELDIYEKYIMSWKYRHECEKAIREKDNVKLIKNLECLKEVHNLTINEKIKYYKSIHPAKSFYYRILRRLLSFRINR